MPSGNLNWRSLQWADLRFVEKYRAAKLASAGEALKRLWHLEPQWDKLRKTGIHRACHILVALGVWNESAA